MVLAITGRQTPACCTPHHVLASVHDGAVRIIADSTDFRVTTLTIAMARQAIEPEDTTMAGESAHFGLRHRAPTPAIRPFELPPRLQAMGERAKSGLAESFHGIAPDGKLASGVFSIEKTGISLAPVMEAARAFLATLSPAQRSATSFRHRRRGVADVVQHPSVGDAARRLPCRSGA